MFSETITITVNAQAKVLTRVNQDSYSSEYRLKETTGEFSLRIRNTAYLDRTRNGGVNVDRHNVELIHTVYPVAPATIPIVRKSYLVFENDKPDALTDVSNFVVGFGGFITATNVTKMANWES